MVSLPPGFLPIYAKAIQGGIEITLLEIAVALELPDSCPVLEQVHAVKETVAACQLELLPDLTKGGLDTGRILRSTIRPNIDREWVLSEIATGETNTQEFKSSLMYDHKRAEANLGAPYHELKSEKVTFSCLRTIAAFLTSNGGVLYIGVNDDGGRTGIECDFPFLQERHRNKDGWELCLRGLISGRFKDGACINDYVYLDFAEIDDNIIARVSVQRRSALSFVKVEKAFVLFRRQGNMTVEVNIEDVAEFIELRRLQTQS